MRTHAATFVVPNLHSRRIRPAGIVKISWIVGQVSDGLPPVAAAEALEPRSHRPGHRDAFLNGLEEDIRSNRGWENIKRLFLT
jgi:hypothetical protein